MCVLKVTVKVISLPYIFQVLYVLCFSRPRYQVSVYRTIGPLVYLFYANAIMLIFDCQDMIQQCGHKVKVSLTCFSGSGDLICRASVEVVIHLLWLAVKCKPVGHSSKLGCVFEAP